MSTVKQRIAVLVSGGGTNFQAVIDAIERGDYTAQLFLDELKQMTTQVVREVKADKSGMRCPVCGRGMIIRGKTRYGCSRWREGCTYAEAFE